LFSSLWPRIEPSDEEQASYRRVSDRYSEGEVVRTLRGLKDTRERFPSPAALGLALKHDRERYQHEKPAEIGELAKAERERERRENAEHWSMIRTMLAALTEDELQQHKQTLLAHDWRTGWMADRPVTSRGWQALIWQRLSDGYEATEPPRYEVPSRPTKAGNLAEALA
jgi:hypothetical protein